MLQPSEGQVLVPMMIDRTEKLPPVAITLKNLVEVIHKLKHTPGHPRLITNNRLQQRERPSLLLHEMMNRTEVEP
jgi:hypothetical protein